MEGLFGLSMPLGDNRFQRATVTETMGGIQKGGLAGRERQQIAFRTLKTIVWGTRHGNLDQMPIRSFLNDYRRNVKVADVQPIALSGERIQMPLDCQHSMTFLRSQWIVCLPCRLLLCWSAMRLAGLLSGLLQRLQLQLPQWVWPMMVTMAKTTQMMRGRRMLITLKPSSMTVMMGRTMPRTMPTNPERMLLEGMLTG